MRVCYADPETDEVTELSQTIAENEFAEEFTAASARFQLSAVIAEYAEILRDSYWAKENDLSTLAVDARRIAEYMPGDAEVQEFASLVTTAANLSE